MSPTEPPLLTRAWKFWGCVEEVYVNWAGLGCMGWIYTQNEENGPDRTSWCAYKEHPSVRRNVSFKSHQRICVREWHGEEPACVPLQRMIWEVEEFKHCCVLASVQSECEGLSQAGVKCFCSYLWTLIEALGKIPR